jgi:hypothetical protein
MLRSQLGIVVHSTSATYRHGLHADQRGGSNTEQDLKSIKVVDVLPRSYLVPGVTESFETRFAVCDWSIWSCQQKSGLCILRFNH